MKRSDQPTNHLGVIARLPWTVRREINCKLRDQRFLKYIAQWLFEQTAPEDLPELCLVKGDAFSKIYAGRDDPLHNCCVGLGRYRQSACYQAWFEDEKRTGLVGSVLANLDAVEAVGGSKQETTNGINRFALSVIIEKLEKAAGADGTIEDLTSLTKAIASLNSGMVASRKADLDQRKLALLEKKATDAQSVTQNVRLTPEEKQQRYKEIFGIA